MTTTAETTTRRLNTSKAMAEAIAQEMRRDEGVVYLGEDVGSYGGIFPPPQGCWRSSGRLG